MKKLIFVCLLAFSTHALASANPAVVAGYVDTFETIDELLQNLEALSLISPEERRAVEQIIETKKLSKRLVKSQATAKKISWGSASLEMRADHTFKAKNGTLLRLNQMKSFDQAFEQTLQAVRGRTTALSLFVPSARADAYETAMAADPEAMSAAAYFGAYHAFQTVSTGLQTAGSVVLVPAAASLETVATGLRYLISPRAVTCSGDGYFIHRGGFKSAEWKKAFEKGKADHEKARGSDAGLGHSSNLTGINAGAVALLTNALSWKKSPDEPVSPETLKVAWPDGKAPKCSEENVRKLRTDLREAAVREFAKLEASRRSPDSGSSVTRPTAR